MAETGRPPKKASNENAMEILESDLLDRWLIGDTQATRVLASLMNGAQFAAFSRGVVPACMTALSAPPRDISRVVESIRLGGDPSDLRDLSALAVEGRARALAHSPEARLWSVIEQALNVVRSSSIQANSSDNSDGYYLLIATALFYVSVGEDRRATLRGELAAALGTATS